MDIKVNKLRSLTEKLCRFSSHLKFLQICITEGLTPKGMNVHYAMDALPSTAFLHGQISNILQSATYSVLCTCRAFYTRAITEIRNELDAHLCLNSSLCLFFIFTYIHNLHIRHIICETLYAWTIHQQSFILYD